MVAWLKAQNIQYFVVEAIDQPWKSYDLEGKAGGYWGLWNADRQQKFEWTGPIETFPQWWVYAAWSLAAALPLMMVFLWYWPTCGWRGQLAFCGLVVLSTSAVAYGASVAAGTYMVTGEMIGWAVLAFFLVLSLAMALIQALELVETIWRRRWLREALPAAEMIARQPADRHWPKVSMHRRDLQRAAGDGDPDPRVAGRARLSRTSKSSSSTTTPRTPRCGARCRTTARQLGERFRFFHFDVMKGFKAGALNYVLEPDRARRRGDRRDRQRLHGAARLAEGAGAVFRRRQDRLRAVRRRTIATGPATASRKCCNWEYAGFFDIGMCLRNEYDAIIQHGTMTLVRRTCMEEMDGWATWCITEDTELGLRLMENGYGAMYSRERFGHGLTPDHFAGYKKQRFRWAYGAMQIMKAHAGKMCSATPPSSPSGRSIISSPAGCRGSPTR